MGRNANRFVKNTDYLDGRALYFVKNEVRIDLGASGEVSGRLVLSKLG